MDVNVFVRQPNTAEYSKLGKQQFAALPRIDEFISAEWEGSKRYFQVLAIHHPAHHEAVELYAIQSEPPWELKKGRAIGFGGR
jgi:hypothetical protein